MDENKNLNKTKLSEKLPTHTPDPGSWQRLSAKLDLQDAEAAFQEKLEQLPVHTPDPGTWNLILLRLNRAYYIKTGIRVALSAAAGLLLFLSVSRFIETNRTNKPVPVLSVQEQPSTTPGTKNLTPELQLNQPSYPDQKYYSDIPKKTVSKKSIAGTLPAITKSDPDNLIPTDVITQNQDIASNPIKEPFAPAEELAFQQPSPTTNEMQNAENGSQNSVLRREPANTIVTSPIKYYTPDDPKTGNNSNYFALGMYYLPENIDNGEGTSLFHNVNLTASYNKEKVRFNTSLGMAYNEEQLVFEMNYNINTPVLATGPDGQLDTLGYRVDKMESQYEGTEKHQYFTYNLGIGRKLFSAGKFSTWLSAGAGVGIRLNDPDIISTTERSIKGQYNAQITSVRAVQPEYNDVYVNFITGVDFNYKILNRLSFTFTPTSLWYFKPVLTMNNQPTDELTLGFKTGMKFDF